jgi:hypothetical protein
MKKLLLLLFPFIIYAQVIDTVIPLYDQPRERLLYIPEGNKLFINLDQSRQLLVLDCSTYTIRKIIQIPPSFPCAAYGLWNQRRNKIYYTFNEGPDSIAVIDGQTDSIIKWINYDSHWPACYNSKDDKVYTTNGRSLAIIDCETDSIVKIIPPSPYQFGGFVLWDSIGDKIYTGCSEFGSDKVIVVNCANDSVIAVISTRVTVPSEAVYNTQRRKIYVAGERRQTGAVIDAIGDTLIKNFYPISFFWETQSLIWNKLEDKIYWPGYYDLYIIDCQTDSIFKTMNSAFVFVFDGLRLNHLSNRLYIATFDTASLGNFDVLHIVLKVLDCHNDSVISQISFGRLGMCMEYDSRNVRLYIGDAMDSALYVIKVELQGIEERTKLNPERLTSEIYPNPVKGVLRVRGPLSEKTVKVFDITGKMIKEIATTTSQSRNDLVLEISLKGINPGIYFLKLGKETKKFLVVK